MLFLTTLASTNLKISRNLGPAFWLSPVHTYSVTECQVYLRHGVEDVEVGHPDAVQLVGLDDPVRAVVRGLEAGEPGVVPGHDDGGVQGEGHLHVVHVGLKI